jgi:hypothetical protein
VRSSLPCWFFILVGPLIAGFLVAALIWLLWSPPDVASLIGSFDLPLTFRLWSVPLIYSWRCVSDRLLWSALTLVSDRLLWSPVTLRLWSVPLISLWRCVFDLPWRCVSDRFLCSPHAVASLIDSFDLPWRCVSDRFLWSTLDVASLIGSFDLPWRCVSDRFLWSPDVASLIGSFDLIWRCVSDRLLWAAPYCRNLLCYIRASRTGARTPCPRALFCLQLSVG